MDVSHLYYSGEVINNQAIVLAIDTRSLDVRIIARNVPWGVLGTQAITLASALIDDLIAHREEVGEQIRRSVAVQYAANVIASVEGGWPFTLSTDHLLDICRSGSVRFFGSFDDSENDLDDDEDDDEEPAIERIGHYFDFAPNDEARTEN